MNRIEHVEERLARVEGLVGLLANETSALSDALACYVRSDGAKSEAAEAQHRAYRAAVQRADIATERADKLERELAALRKRDP